MLLLCAPALAQPAYPVTIVAALPGDAPQVEQTILVGSSGQLYRRADDGTWRRHDAGGVSAEVRGAARGPGGLLIAAGAHAPIFRWEDGAWHSRPLPNRGEVGAPAPGSSPAVSVGRHVYVLDKGRWRRVGAAPGPMSVLWAAGPNRIWVADAHGGLYRSTGAAFAPVRTGLAPGEVIVAMAGAAEAELYALSAAGTLLALRPGAAAPVAIPPEAAGLRIDAIGPAPGGALVAGVTGGGAGRPLLLRAARGKLQVEGELPPLPASEPASGPAGDRAAAVRGDATGGVLIATVAGHLLLRRGTEAWTEATVSGALPAGTLRTFPRALPARTR